MFGLKVLPFFLVMIVLANPAFANDVFIKKTDCSKAYHYYFLNRALASGDEIGAKIMLDQGADPNGRDYNANCIGGMEPSTPLSMAIYSGHFDIVKLLLKAGANPNGLDGEGVTPLIVASEKERNDIVELLLKFGAKQNVSGVNSEGKREKPIDIAERRHNFKLIKLLKKYQGNE